MCKRLIYLTSFVLALVAVPLVTNAQVENLVLNPSFEEDEAILDDPNWEQWTTWGWEGGLNSTVAIDATEFIDGARSLRIEPQGGTDWFFILLQDYIPLEVGTQYTVSFWAKAAAPRPLSVKMKATDDSGDWGWTQFQLTTDWAEYSINSAAASASAKLEFHCAATNDTIWLDLVSVDEEVVLPPFLLLNGSFEEDELILDDPDELAWWTWGWEGGLAGTVAFDETEFIDGARSLRIEPRGGTDWFFEVIHLNIALEVGKEYTTSFWAKAAVPRPLGAQMKAMDNSVSWGGAQFDLTTDWAEYSVSSVALNALAKLEFHCAATDDTFWLDLVSLYAGEAGPAPLVANGSFEEDEEILDDPDELAWWTWYPAEGAGSNATIVDTEFIDGARSLMIEPRGGTDWYFIVINSPIPLEVGTTYVTSFWVKAAVPRPLSVAMKATDNSVSWGWTQFQLTTDWAEYSISAPAENATAKLEFQCAATNDTLWLDLVSVTGPEPNAPIVFNGDFELPDEGKINTDWDLIPGWSSDTPPADSGLDNEETYPGYGYSAFLMDGDPNVWQTTAHIIAVGEQFTLSLVASDNYTDLVGNWSVEGGGQLTVSLYYDDGVTRTTVATTDIVPAASYTEMDGPFELAFNAADVPASIGYAIGIEVMNSSPTAVPNHSWVFFDDVQLTVAPPIVTNGDFELPDEGKINTDWDLIPGWSSDTPPADSGLDVEETYPGYGYTAFLMDGDPSVWQTTAHIIAPGNQFTLSLVASDYYTDLVGDWSVLGGGQLSVSLYYDNGVTRTTVATTDIMPAASYTEMYGPFELAFNAADVPASIGYAIGVEIVNSSPTAVPNHSWVFFDNVQLAVTPPLMTNGSFEKDEVILDDPDWEVWTTWGWEDGLSSTVEFDEANYIDGTRSLRIEPRGATDWYFILLQDNIPLEVGTQYTASFWVKAEEPRFLATKLKPTDNSTDGWGWIQFELTTEWAEYAFTSEAQSDEAKLEFHCAGSEVTFWLDFVSIYAGEYIPGVEPGGAVKATEPHPANGAIDVSREITLSWAPGKSADKHEVYLGTVFNDVNNADITDTTGIYRGSQDLDATSYTPIEAPLQWGQTYYWRVDGTEPNTLWKGSVWSFTVANYIVVDDFESYNDIAAGEEGSNLVYSTWIDGYENPLVNGATIGYVEAFQPSMETAIVHGGGQSVPLIYDNSTAGLSEVTRTLNADWTQDGVITLTLFYKGNLTNADEPMYVALNGTVITNDNPKAARAGGWTQWDILLQDFADLGVDLANVITMSIGFGNKANPIAGGSGYVFIDDIRLSRLLPVEPEPRPEPVDPGTGNLVASYSFENNTQDGSGNGLNGTIMGNPAFVEGIAGMALSFDGVNDYVDFGNNAAFDITEQITLSAWVNTNDAGSGQHHPYVGKGDHAYAIKHASSNTIEFFIYDGGWYVAQVKVDDSFNGEWHHVAGTYDGSELKTYVDGILGVTVAHVGLIDVQTHNLTIGTNSEETVRFYDGAIDEVNIYNRALSNAEIRFLVGN